MRACINKDLKRLKGNLLLFFGYGPTVRDFEALVALVARLEAYVFWRRTAGK